MDRAGRLFSRGGSPPATGQQQTPTSQQPQQLPLPGSPQSVHSVEQPNQASASSQHLDSLFRNIGQQQSQPQYSQQQQSATASSTPLSHTSGGTNPQQTAAEKQSALLSTLYGSPQGQPIAPIALHNVGQQERPPSPSSSQRSVEADNPGKMLLETLMAGTAPKQPPTSIPAQQPVQQQQQDYRIAQPVPSIPTPPNLTPDLERGINPPSPQPSPPQQPTQRPQPQSGRQPSPSRKSMFEFASPFDVLAASSSGPRKKPVPPVAPSNAGLSSGPDDPPSPIPALQDTRRKSVENLLEGISKPLPPQAPAAGEPKPNKAVVVQQHQQKASPRASPPRTLAQRPPLRSSEASSLTHIVPAAQAPAGRERGSSPGPRAANNAGSGGQWQSQPQGQGKSAGRGKKQAAPAPAAPQAQSIVFDVSQAEGATLANTDYVKSTAIALLKIDPIFVPGCTIGVTSWVAYAMTRGRVRVIGRANGERTLLQLPPLFPVTTTVIDMVVTGNRLAAVTSDGGFVIWEVPRVVEDDVPAQLLLCVVPSPENPLKVVKWHPKQSDSLAVGSDTEIFLVNVADAINAYHGEPITQNELASLGTVYNLVSPLVSFAFDAANYTIMAISEDSTLSCWSNMDKLPAFTAKINGEGYPSSIDVIEGGVVIGRKQGTVLQLLPAYSADVLSTVRFINGAREDREMFGHVAYDSRIHTLWVANSRRESLIALRISLDPADPHGGYFNQLVESPGLKPTIHFVILSGGADPRGEEAEAACIAAKIQPSELALVAYSVHAHGVDQVLIRQEWFDMALAAIPARPPPSLSALPLTVAQAVVPSGSPSSSDNKPSRVPQHQAHLHHPQPIPLHHNPLAAVPARPRTPSSEDIEAEVAATVDTRMAEVKPRGPKGGAKEKKQKEQQQGQQQGTDKDAAGKSDATASVAGSGSTTTAVSETVLNNALTKEIRKVEENLHTKIGRLITKELDKQQARLEELRAAEQQADFARQEKILKLISTELTKNTTRVVEAAVKTVVQNSVLPSLESITKAEVKAALNGQIAKGLGDSVNQTLPTEIERLLLRPDVANHVARTFSSTVTPLVERHVKEAITKTLIPAYMQQSEAMHTELSREIHSEILNVKKEIITWQSEALKGQESVIRDMEMTVKALSEQVKFLSMNLLPGVQHPMLPPPRRISPVPSHSQQGSSHMRQGPLPVHSGPPPQMYSQNSPYAPPPPPPQNNPAWFQQVNHAPPPPHQPPPPAPVRDQVPPEDWDEVYLSVLGTQDSGQLRDLLARSNPDIIMPLNGPVPLSQAVVLTLSHRIAQAISETSPMDEFFKSGIWWIQRSMAVLNVNDPVISAYVARVLPTVLNMLSTTRQRIGILPVPQAGEASRIVSDLQELVNRKMSLIPIPA